MTRADLPTSPQRILLIKPSALGDVVHTLPILNLLRRKWPSAHISWLINNDFASLVRGHPQLDELVLFDRNRLSTWWRDPSATKALFSFVRELSAKQFDLVIDLQGLMRSGWLTALTRAPARVGFANARELAYLFYTHHVPIDSMDQHAIERYLAVAEFLGCGRDPVEFKFVTDESDRAHVDQLVNGVGKFAVLMPGTNWPTKRWPVERFAELVTPLRERFGLATVVAGGRDVAEIASQIPATINAVNKTDLRQLVALLERADLVIANDTGPMHIASAMGKPLVTIFGPTNPVRTGPFGRMESVVRVDIPCSPCYSRRCSHTSCMKWVKGEDVMEEVARQLTRET
jgi:lipopolysaccharide heptosyltransferase I